jgi:hypothetical protein
MARRAKMTTGDWMPSAETGYWLIAVSWFGGSDWGSEKNGATGSSRRAAVEKHSSGMAATAP